MEKSANIAKTWLIYYNKAVNTNDKNMENINNDPSKIKDVLERGVEKIYPNREEVEKVLLSGKKLKIYCGFDPSAPALHIGNAIQLIKLSHFQDLGHEIIFLIGDFTGMIGDPTDKNATRRKLTREEVTANAKKYKQQASRFIKFSGVNPARVVKNSKWLDKITFKDLIELSSNFTVQQMIIRDMFQERLKEEKPIHLHEFLYPLAQGYDTVALDVDMEIGGNDQMFNMMAGRHLMKALKDKEKFVITNKLIADDTGKKMGKSEGNVVFLDEEPNNVYGKIMSWPDGVLGVAFELCTKLPYEDVRKIQEKLKDLNINPRDLKMKLAFEITKLIHGAGKAKKAQDYFIRTIQKKEAPMTITNYELKITNIKLIDLLVEIKFASSKGDARRLIEQGGVKINEEVTKDFNKELTVTPEGFVLQKGKLNFIRVVKI